VWRNYSRVFGAQLLAAKVGRLLVCTELCHKLAAGEIECDEYLLHLANRFYFPSPVFKGYDPRAEKVFPFAALVKLLVARARAGGQAGVSVDEAITKLIGNSVRGTEPLEHFVNLPDAPSQASEVMRRQIRELMIFLSQASFLKWSGNALYLDAVTPGLAEQVATLVHPFDLPSEGDAGREIISLGRHFEREEVQVLAPPYAIEEAAAEFSEGSKVRVTHLRYERSSKLREMFFAQKNNPQICDMCELDTNIRYPWAQRVIEVHHLLPLSSPIRVDVHGTSLADVVGLCPSCHRATHRFYGKWLKEEGISDFRSYEEARAVYETTKNSIG
jgi:hypothetical protein